MTPLTSLSGRLQNGGLSSAELIRSTLERIHEKNPVLNLFPETFDDEALRLAAESDARRRAGRPLSPWDGIPFAMKDNFLYEGHAMYCASPMLKDYTAPYTATAVTRLLRAGFIPVGRLNMDEFAMGSLGKNSLYGPARNPADPARYAGGSSSGSAAAVAAGLVPFALASDTGGSVRVPAAFCGAVGVKPAYGTVSRWGMTAFASSLDCVSLAAEAPEDCVPLMDLIAGEDGHDATVLPGLWNHGSLPSAFRVGYAEVPSLPAYQAFLSRLENAGFPLLPLPIPGGEESLAAYRILSSAEAYSNLSRYDGIRYGYRSSAPAATLEEHYLHTRTEGFGPEVKRRVDLGGRVLRNTRAWENARASREKSRETFRELFSSCDCYLCPTSDKAAPLLNEEDSVSMDLYTVPASLAGLPSLSLPLKTEGLPAGVCLTGPADSLHALLKAASLFSPFL